MPGLLFYRGDREVLRFPLSAPRFTVGRHPSNDLTLPDEEISRFHLTLERKEDQYWFQDQSRNGTFLNRKITDRALLKDGDEIGIGSWRIIFRSDAEWGEQETVLKKKTKAVASFSGIIGKSERMQRVFAMIEKVAPTTTTVLIMGETGTGKELVARAIHDRSPRMKRPLVPINCGAISPQLIESELFGHERGAFTGALGRHIGAFEQANGGTLFLDEVGELPLELQPKLLRVLEEKKIRRVGGTQEIPVDVRVIAATHRNLETMSREGKFREDLYFRLFLVPIQLPPLRERGDDIAVLAQAFVETLQGEGKKLSPEALQKLADHSWRGNVRELKNVMTRSLLFSAHEKIGPEEILFLSDSGDPSLMNRPKLETAERDTILNALKENEWNKKKTAEVLGIAKSTLFNKIKEYQIKEKD